MRCKWQFASLSLTDGSDDRNGVEESSGEGPRLSVLVLFAIPSFLLLGNFTGLEFSNAAFFFVSRNLL